MHEQVGARVVTALGVSASTLVLLVVAAFAAGWVDAVVGGGGLIQLPALLIGLPASTPPAAVLGTNKISSVWGTATSSVTYVVKLRPDWRSVVPLVIGAVAGSALGAQAARFLPKRYFTPIVLIALIAVGIYTWRRPDLGLVSERKYDGRSHAFRVAAIGLGVGAYDGFLGPGTGSFFVILLVTVVGYEFLEASAEAKIANLFTNLAAIAVFAATGSVLWGLGLTMGAANLAGGFVGARMALRGGNAFVRQVFLLVVAALILKLGYDTVSELLG